MGNILDNFQKKQLEEVLKNLDEIRVIIKDNFAVGIETEISRNLMNKTIEAIAKVTTTLEISNIDEKNMLEDVAEQASKRG